VRHEHDIPADHRSHDRVPERAQTVRPIQDLDLVVEPGELVLLHGPSGCGKTTLLSAIAGLLTPEAGSIVIGGDDVVGLRGKAMLAHRRRRVGMVFQGFNLLPSLTAEENVAVPLTIAGVAPREARRRARAQLAQLDMDHRRHHRPGTLSGGQQQRVAIARALVADPPVLLADEPTAHLDHTQVDVVRAQLRTIADAGRIVVISTHDDRLDVAADRIVRMGDAHRPIASAPQEATSREPRVPLAVG
jgi:putative ABC transport system ATP-binding protein